MNQSTRLPSASSGNTLNFADDGAVIAELRTTTKSTQVVKIDLGESLPEGYATIEELVAEVEHDSQGRRDLEEGRKWVAKAFYKGEQTLRSLRLQRGLSQSGLAATIGTTQAHIARVESGASDAQVSTLTRMAKALRVDSLIAVKAFLNARRAAGALEDE